MQATDMMISRAPAGDEPRSAPLGLRITPRLKAELEALAKADRRTLASYVELALEAHVEAKKQEAGKKRR
jgi:predicted HicB family RNase H-like nuclease